MYDPILHRHCVVARKGYFFAVDFVDGHGDPLPFHILEKRLEQCVDMANELQSLGTVPHFGLLTTGDRDSWADARSRLLEMGGSSMKHAMEKLERVELFSCVWMTMNRYRCSSVASITGTGARNLDTTGGLTSPCNLFAQIMEKLASLGNIL